MGSRDHRRHAVIDEQATQPTHAHGFRAVVDGWQAVAVDIHTLSGAEPRQAIVLSRRESAWQHRDHLHLPRCPLQQLRMPLHPSRETCPGRSNRTWSSHIGRTRSRCSSHNGPAAWNGVYDGAQDMGPDA